MKISTFRREKEFTLLKRHEIRIKKKHKLHSFNKSIMIRKILNKVRVIKRVNNLTKIMPYASQVCAHTHTIKLNFLWYICYLYLPPNLSKQ